VHNRWKFPIWVLVVLVIASVIGSLIIAFFRNLTPLESVLLQFLSLAAGLGGSYYFGLKTEGEAAKTLVEPSARSAIRRVYSIYSGLSQVLYEIESGRVEERDDAVTLQILEAIVMGQIQTVDDALEDWRQFAPDAVLEIETRAKQG